MIAPTRDEWFSSDAAYLDSREEICDRCGAHVRADQGSAVILKDSTDEGWFCFDCCEDIAADECDEAREPELDWDDSCDGDHASALESVYGPND